MNFAEDLNARKFIDDKKMTNRPSDSKSLFDLWSDELETKNTMCIYGI
jgi:hypothetical protein